jgi:hypothetical protein
MAARTQRREVDRHYEPKDVSEAGAPDWAQGCPKCVRGLVSPPEAAPLPAPLYAALVALARVGRLRFCDCDAGKAMERFLRQRYAEIRAGRDRYPDWQAIEDAAATPSVRYVGG